MTTNVAAVFALRRITKIIDNIMSGRFGEVSPALMKVTLDHVYHVAQDALNAPEAQ